MLRVSGLNFNDPDLRAKLRQEGLWRQKRVGLFENRADEGSWTDKHKVCMSVSPTVSAEYLQDVSQRYGRGKDGITLAQ